MSQTYKIREVTVTLPSLGTITTDGAGNKVKSGDKCRVQLYAVKPDTLSGIPFDGYVVGAISFTGFTESPFKRPQKILMPDGYKLVALRVDDDGVPTSWESLPVHFSGGYIGSPEDVLDGIAELPLYKISSDIAIQQKIADALDTVMDRYHEQFGNTEPEKTAVVFLLHRWVAIEGYYTADEISDAVAYIKHKRLTNEFGKEIADLSPFSIKKGQVFINDAFIGNGVASANYSVKMGVDRGGKNHAGGVGVSVSNASATKKRLTDDMREAITDAVNDVLRIALKPDGIIWNNLRGR